MAKIRRVKTDVLYPGAARAEEPSDTLALSGLVGDPGIEPGMSRLGGVTVRCRTLQHIAH